VHRMVLQLSTMLKKVKIINLKGCQIISLPREPICLGLATFINNNSNDNNNTVLLFLH
jgi:hypothetical protein